VLQNMTNEPATNLLPEDVDESDIIWGLTNIGREINRTPKEIGYLVRNTDLLNHAVRRISHKIYIGSRSKLRNVALTALARD
jgi:hypothetical protein